MRFYSIPACMYSSLTIHILSRSTVIDKRRFLVRLFSALHVSHVCARTYCACSHFFSRSPPRCCVRLYCISVHD